MPEDRVETLGVKSVAASLRDSGQQEIRALIEVAKKAGLMRVFEVV